MDFNAFDTEDQEYRTCKESEANTGIRNLRQKTPGGRERENPAASTSS